MSTKPALGLKTGINILSCDNDQPELIQSAARTLFVSSFFFSETTRLSVPNTKAPDQKAGMSVEANVAFPERISSPPPPPMGSLPEGGGGGRVFLVVASDIAQLQVKKRAWRGAPCSDALC